MNYIINLLFTINTYLLPKLRVLISFVGIDKRNGLFNFNYPEYPPPYRTYNIENSTINLRASSSKFTFYGDGARVNLNAQNLEAAFFGARNQFFASSPN